MYDLNSHLFETDLKLERELKVTHPLHKYYATHYTKYHAAYRLIQLVLTKK